MAEARRKYIAEVIDVHNGNMAAAARAAGMSRQHLFKLAAELGIRVIRASAYGSRGNEAWGAVS